MIKLFDKLCAQNVGVYFSFLCSVYGVRIGVRCHWGEIGVRGDYIIKGLRGELYPCKPDIFEKSYEKV